MTPITMDTYKTGLEQENEKLDSYKYEALTCAREYSRKMPDYKKRINSAKTVAEVERTVRAARKLMYA